MAKINLPPYLQLRDGRPRWQPGPGLRARGYKGKDLKDAAGNWLSVGKAIDEAKKINAAIENGDTAEILPPTDRSMNALFDAYMKSTLFTVDLSPLTQRHYASHISILRAWCGDVPANRLSRTAIREFHAQATVTRGLSMANALVRVVKLVLYFGADELEPPWLDKVAARKLKMSESDGRLVVWSPEEIFTFIATADQLGCEGQGDAVAFGALTGQRRADLLCQPRTELGGNYYVVHQRKGRKHKAKAFVPFTAPLRARIEKARARAEQRWPNVTQQFEILSSETGHAYPVDGSAFHKEFRFVLTLAAGVPIAIENFCRAIGGLPQKLPNTRTCPSLADKLFQDLRDTAVTWLAAAACSVPEIANITGHSLKTVQQILDKHYFVRNAELAGTAGAKLDAYLAKVWA